MPVLTVYFMGGAYEVTGTNVKKYYSIAGMTVAMNDGSGLKYLLTDHLGSVVAITDSSGTLISQQRYLPFGQVRTDVGNIAQTDYGYTGQRALSMGLMDYKARMYDSALGKFIQPDTIIPEATNPQSFNRYSYVTNRPINLNDPTGHDESDNYKLRKLKHNYGRYWNDVRGAWHREGDRALVEWSNRIAAERARAAALQAAERARATALQAAANARFCMLNPGECYDDYGFTTDPTQNPQTPSVTRPSSENGTCPSCVIRGGAIIIAAGILEGLFGAAAIMAVALSGPAAIPATALVIIPIEAVLGNVTLIGIEYIKQGENRPPEKIDIDYLPLLHLITNPDEGMYFE